VNAKNELLRTKKLSLANERKLVEEKAILVQESQTLKKSLESEIERNENAERVHII
jgi:hypothetical protein